MSARSLAAVAALCAGSLAAAPLAAQSSQCTSQAVALQDACQKGTDIFTMLMPQVQGALAGGGPVLGSSRGVRALSIGVRVNAVDGVVPDLTTATLSVTGMQQTTFDTKKVPVPMPVVDIGLGIFPGFNIGVQRLFALDALVNASYMPKYESTDFSVKPTKGAFKFGYGARLGILADKLFVPAVSVSYFRRQVPSATISTSFESTISGFPVKDSLALSELSSRNDAIRISASKKLMFLEIGGGVGQDTYQTFAQLNAKVSPTIVAPVSGQFVLTQKAKRNVAYGSVALNIFKLRIAAEAGQISGGDSLATYNSFTDGKLNEKKLFGSVGIRLNF